MKIAFYVEDGSEQIVLTPESETEKGIVGKMHDGTREFKVYKGSFYRCQGGWVRQSDHDDKSTIIVLEPKEKTE